MAKIHIRLKHKSVSTDTVVLLDGNIPNVTLRRLIGSVGKTLTDVATVHGTFKLTFVETEKEK